MAGSSSTKAPKSAVRVTLPLTTCPAGIRFGIVSHGLAVSCRSPRLSLRLSRSILSTSTLTGWPGCNTLVASATRVQLISLTCTKPSTPPRSTKAPKSLTERTTPSRTWPSASSSHSFSRSDLAFLLEQGAAADHQVVLARIDLRRPGSAAAG